MMSITAEDLLGQITELTATLEKEKIQEILSVVDALSPNLLTQEQRDGVTAKHRLIIDPHLAEAVPGLDSLSFVVVSPLVPLKTMYLIAGDDWGSLYKKPGMMA